MKYLVLMALLPHHPLFHSQQREDSAEPDSEVLKPLPVDQEVCLWKRHKEDTAVPNDPECLDLELELQLWMLVLPEEHQAWMGDYMSHRQGLWQLFHWTHFPFPELCF